LSVLADDVSLIGEAIVFNLIGAPFIWLFFVVLILLFDALRPRPAGVGRWCYGLAAIGLGVSLSILVFLVFQTFYDVAPVKITATFSAPAKGVFYVGKPDETLPNEPGALRSMSILPRQSPAAGASIISPGKQLKVAWKRTDPQSQFAVEVRFFADCPYPEKLSDLPSSAPALNVPDIKTLRASFSTGNSHLIVDHRANREYSLIVPDLAQYWVKAEPGPAISSVEAFIDAPTRMEIDPSSGVRFYLSAPLMKSDGDESRNTRRTLQLMVDGHDYRLSAGGGQIYPGDSLRCRSVLPMFTESNSVKRAALRDLRQPMFLGALVELRNVPTAAEVFRPKRSDMVINGANGWAKITGLDFKYMRDHRLGRGNGFAAEEGLKGLRIDGEPIEIDVESDFSAFGEFYSTMEEETVKVEGTADFVWLNGKRLNPTLWERLALGWQIPLITALAGLIGLLVRSQWPRIAEIMQTDSRLNIRGWGA
jgi:hypothetical protein